MCGFAGFIDISASTPQEALERLAGAMVDPIRHRGPDAGGVWADAAAGFAVGFRRLAIIDLSAAGNQPMISASGRNVIVYNGEIYNTAEIRADLEALGIRFRGHSDTEVVLEACEAWGVETAVARMNGMFAFALWDRRERHLQLVRDRVGIKPLYWGRLGGTIFFGSQSKSFAAHPAWRGEIDREALAAYFQFGYVPSPLSVFRGIRQVEPGRIVSLEAGGTVRDTVYWDARSVAEKGQGDLNELTEQDAVEELDRLLRDAVKRRLVSDVPLGAFLSGGIDSSTVVALMQSQSMHKVKSFSIGFHESDYDEATYAKAIAGRLGTDHSELYVGADQVLDLVPSLAQWYDEPFADSSQIPTLLVSQLARRSVTVSLSGDGGDELFAGYNHYVLGETIWRRFGTLPLALRHAMAGAMKMVPPDGWDAIDRFLPSSLRYPQFGDKVHKVADVITGEDSDAMYARLLSHWKPETAVVRGAAGRNIVKDAPGLQDTLPGLMERMQYLDLVTYLPDDILTKLDRATMAVSLEGRVPLLDFRVVEWAWRLPRSLKVRDGNGKWILRRVLDRYVPSELFERPKKGFGLPLDAWLRGPLREWAEAMLAEPALEAHGLLNAAPIRARWQEHLSGRRNWHHSLWCVLMFQSWHRTVVEGTPE